MRSSALATITSRSTSAWGVPTPPWLRAARSARSAAARVAARRSYASATWACSDARSGWAVIGRRNRPNRAEPSSLRPARVQVLRVERAQLNAVLEADPVADPRETGHRGDHARGARRDAGQVGRGLRPCPSDGTGAHRRRPSRQTYRQRSRCSSMAATSPGVRTKGLPIRGSRRISAAANRGSDSQLVPRHELVERVHVEPHPEAPAFVLGRHRMRGDHARGPDARASTTSPADRSPTPGSGRPAPSARPGSPGITPQLSITRLRGEVADDVPHLGVGLEQPGRDLDPVSRPLQRAPPRRYEQPLVVPQLPHT